MDPIRIWFDPPHVRWGRVAVTVVIASALVGSWVAQGRGMFDAAPAQAAVAGAATGGMAASDALRGARPLASASAPLVAAAPAKAASSVEIVCGLGAVSFDPDDEAQIERLTSEANEKLQAHRASVMPGWLEEMKSSPDEQVQAAAWFLEARNVWLKRVEFAQAPESLDAVDELARLAQRSRDPLTYALAFQSCEVYRPRATAKACQALSVEAWAERDPDNAYPWLFGAGVDGVDSLRRSRYIERALAAGTIRSSWGALHPAMAKAAPPNEAPLDRSVRVWEAVSADSFLSIAQAGVIEHCKDGELRQGARRQQCEHLAAFMTDKADTFTDVAFGSAIGKRLGWSEDRLSRLKADILALQKSTPEGAEIVGCTGLTRAEAYFVEVARYGELGTLRRRLQAAQAASAPTGR